MERMKSAHGLESIDLVVSVGLLDRHNISPSTESSGVRLAMHPHKGKHLTQFDISAPLAPQSPLSDDEFIASGSRGGDLALGLGGPNSFL